ncbi:hypothetical protein HPP92_025075 [Vanilla planifolia]|uniref:DNL-type domain-containing protein n=1 Tax=Vanilla planifolia TaxID=51239 RepID=A0A835PH70_VANPL|nr:hypothetical protein HPP92_025075 [Vanilla planifolia]
MASVRLLYKRLASIVSSNRPRLPSNPGGQWPFLSSNINRSICMKIERVEKSNGDTEDQKPIDCETHPPSADKLRDININASVSYTAFSNLKTSSRHDLAMIFTCKVCETRSVKTVCRESYEKGVVVARCSGCNNLHLIADHLGWFGEPGSIEDLLVARGEEVRKGSMDTLNLTLEDLIGKKSKL